MTGKYKYAPGLWGVLAQEYRRALESDNKSENTIRIYLGVIYQAGTWASELAEPKDPTTITKSELRDYFAKVRKETSAGNAHNHYRSLNTFFEWLVKEEEIDVSPMLKVNAPDYEPPLIPIIHRDNVAKLLATCEGRDFVSRRDAAIIRVLAASAGRRAEVSYLDLDDVRLDTEEIKVFGKGRRERIIPIGGKTAQALSRYIRVRARHPQAALPALWLGSTGQGAMTHEGIRAVVARRAEQAGIGHVHPHMFRHAFAHYWQLEEGNENDLMRIMGWKSREMLGRYGASAADERAHASARRLALGDRV
ncbi:tyrosine-type recombinase/integrase [Amycolatopsis thermophila]|uniref:Site-specific recombinase XerD n=1 Tax=Amycolatopsis thermophila TaxID=206084 RepID=A0ABU0ERQ4_9PSEU|nr:tyrosine-type recombinase/integrase [Amycolatopsis thermophila]MDQ0377974.1 site-specific recombinase XerD [Amycolatopsis thermophila]